MEQLNADERERRYLAQRLMEAFSLRGVPCLLYQVKVHTETLNKDPKVTYMDPVESFMMFEDNPQIVLKKMKWFIEGEKEAFIGHLVAHDVNYTPVSIRNEMRVDLMSHLQIGDNVTHFLVKQTRADQVNQVSWIVKLVPYYEVVPVSEELLNDNPGDREFRQVYFKRDIV